MSAPHQLLGKLITIIGDAAGKNLDVGTSMKLRSVATVLDSLGDEIISGFASSNERVESIVTALETLETTLDQVVNDVNNLIVAAKPATTTETTEASAQPEATKSDDGAAVAAQ